MKYRNTKTGAVVEVESKIGGNWEPVEAPVPVSDKVESKPRPAQKKGVKKQ